MLDLVIRGGQVLDGLGSPARRADVGVRDGRIVAVGEIAEPGREEIDARGAIVTPGFVDVHTHYDGQAVWSDRFSPSSQHGVTTVVMGNCGVGFAPCRKEDHELLVSVMEGVEDVPEIVMTAGLDWHWETFPEYLDAIDSRPHDIDFGVYLPHSPLRVYAMGSRGAAREPATDQDLARMAELTREAMEAGALGFATSSVAVHRTGKGDAIPSYDSDVAEYLAIAKAMGATGKGLFQMVLEQRAKADHPRFVPLLEGISKHAGVTVTFTMLQMSGYPSDNYRHVLNAVSEANRDPGVSIRPQVFPRPVGMILALDLSANPFMFCPSYAALAGLPQAERAAAMRDPELRSRLIAEPAGDPTHPLLAITRDWARLYPLRKPADYAPASGSSIADLAAAQGVSPESVAYDLLMENDGNGQIFAALSNFADRSLDPVRELLVYPEAVVGLGDGGAHYGMICDASYPTFLLSYWTRDREEQRIDLGEAVAALSSRPARLVGLNDRGVIAPGYKADLNVIDYDRLTLKMPHVERDLPAGGRRVSQAAEGYRATIVSGQVIQRDGVATAARPGRLVRGAQPAPA